MDCKTYKDLNNKLDSDFTRRAMANIILFLTSFVCNTIARRIAVTVMILCKIPVKEISSRTGVSKSLIYKICEAINRLDSPDDIGSLFIFKSGSGRKNPLSSIEDAVAEAIDTKNFFCLKQIVDWIHDNLRVSVCTKTLSRTLKRSGVRKLKAGSLPAKADVERQRNFYNETLKPLMDEARQGKIALLFVDASHFVMGCDYLAAIYGKTRRFAKTFSGRSRYNVLGALDYHTKDVLTITNNKYINAESVCGLIKKARERYGSDKKIVFILDNASYQKCKPVTECAKKHDITLEYLPPYSPNLNLIERLWRFTKKHLRKDVWTDYPLFCKRIDSIVSSTTKENKAEIETLIGEKIQFFDYFVKVNEDTVAMPLKKKAA